MSDPVLMMVICGIVFGASLLIVAINFARMMGSGKMNGLAVIVHLVIGGLSALSGLGLAAGFIWFLIDRYAG